MFFLCSHFQRFLWADQHFHSGFVSSATVCSWPKQDKTLVYPETLPSRACLGLMINIHAVKFMVAVREGPGIWGSGGGCLSPGGDTGSPVCLIELVAHRPRLPGRFKV